MKLPIKKVLMRVMDGTKQRPGYLIRILKRGVMLTAFEKYWKDFEDPALKIKSAKEGKEEMKREKRAKDDILYEILERVRRLESAQNSIEKLFPPTKVSSVKTHDDDKKI